jgi:flagellar FliL protein
MSSNNSNAKTPWLAMILLAVGCSAASVGGMYYFNKQKAEAAAEPVVVVAEKPIFVKVDPFTVNLESERSSRMLYVGISLRVEDQVTADFLKEYMTALRSRLLIKAGESKIDVISTPEGKNALKAEVLAMLNEPFSTPQPELKVKEVLFNEFIVQ